MHDHVTAANDFRARAPVGPDDLNRVTLAHALSKIDDRLARHGDLGLDRADSAKPGFHVLLCRGPHAVVVEGQPRLRRPVNHAATEHPRLAGSFPDTLDVAG